MRIPVVAAFVCAATAAAQGPFAPAQRLAGRAPGSPSPMTVGWVSESVEVTVDAAGRAQFVEPLQASSNASLLRAAIEGWTFRPASADGKPVASHVLVAAIYRPPITVNGPTVGTPPSVVGASSSDVPSPSATVVPDYPANVIADGVVVLELRVGTDGTVAATKVVDSAPGFDDVSLDAARRWTFTPAERDGHPVEAYVYVVFGFRRPVV